MHLDQVITVFCTDHETQKKGKIIRIYSSGIDVEVSGTIIKLKKTKPKQKSKTKQLPFRMKTFYYSKNSKLNKQVKLS